MHRYWRGRRRGSEAELPDDLLRFGVEFDDGRKATSLAWEGTDVEGETPPGPILMQHGVAVGAAATGWGWWLGPLPPGERLTFVCEWPARGSGSSGTTSTQRRSAERRSEPARSGRASYRSRLTVMEQNDADSEVALRGYGDAVDLAVRAPTLAGVIVALLVVSVWWACRHVRRRQHV